MTLEERVALLEEAQKRSQGRVLHKYVGEYVADNAPDSVRSYLEKARKGDINFKASGVGWRDVLTPRRVLMADGTQVSNTTTETIMCPDFTFAADYFEPGDAFKYTILGNFSGQAAANTVTVRLKYGGVGGTAMATSGAFAFDPTAASTTVTEMFEFYFVCRSVGTSGSFFTIGRATWNDFDDASATTLKNNLDMLMIPASAPAVVSSLDTTTAKAISPTIQFSSGTATIQWTTNIAILESLN